MYIYTHIYTVAGLITHIGDAVIMGWLRLVGCLKSQVSFAEYSFFYRAFWQKRPAILRSLLMIATPYQLHDMRHTFIYTHIYTYFREFDWGM